MRIPAPWKGGAERSDSHASIRILFVREKRISADFLNLLKPLFSDMLQTDVNRKPHIPDIMSD